MPATDATPIVLAHLHAEAMANGQNPRVHPNGFIQLDLEPVRGDWHDSHQRGHSGAARRLHIWNPPGVQLPHQETVNEIHDHVFDMKSTVVIGQLWQRLFKFEVIESLPVEGGIITPGYAPQPTHRKYRAIYNKGADSRLEATDEFGTLNMYSRFPVRAGQRYTQPAFTLHDTETPLGLVVTVMEKTEIHEGDAHVVCPIDSPPDNSFDRASAMDDAEIWKIISEVLSA